MKGLPGVFVLILNYCSQDDTLDCVEFVKRSDYPNFKLYVLDNCSPDGSGSFLASRLPANEFIQLSSNTGYAGGNNIGIAMALSEGSEYVLILNPDIRLPPDAISTYVCALEADPGSAGVNSVQVGADGVSIDNSFRSSVLRDLTPMVDATERGIKQVAYYSDTLFGAALMLRVRALRTVGVFDPLYFAYGEETDLCRRLRYHGFTLMVLMQPTVVHLRSAYAGGMSDRLLFLRLKGFYLSEIKDPGRSFWVQYWRALRDLCLALIGRPPRRYPFASLPIRRAHALSALGWFLKHGGSIWVHKRGDLRGPMYLQGTDS